MTQEEKLQFNKTLNEIDEEIDAISSQIKSIKVSVAEIDEDKFKIIELENVKEPRRESILEEAQANERNEFEESNLPQIFFEMQKYKSIPKEDILLRNLDQEAKEESQESNKSGEDEELVMRNKYDCPNNSDPEQRRITFAENMDDKKTPKQQDCLNPREIIDFRRDQRLIKPVKKSKSRKVIKRMFKKKLKPIGVERLPHPYTKPKKIMIGIKDIKKASKQKEIGRRSKSRYKNENSFRQNKIVNEYYKDSILSKKQNKDSISKRISKQTSTSLRRKKKLFNSKKKEHQVSFSKYSSRSPYRYKNLSLKKKQNPKAFHSHHKIKMNNSLGKNTRKNLNYRKRSKIRSVKSKSKNSKRSVSRHSKDLSQKEFNLLKVFPNLPKDYFSQYNEYDYNKPMEREKSKNLRCEQLYQLSKEKKRVKNSMTRKNKIQKEYEMMKECTFHPDIYSKDYIPDDDFLRRNNKWVRERNIKQQMNVSKKLQKEVQNYKSYFTPHINNQSRRIVRQNKTGFEERQKAHQQRKVTKSRSKKPRRVKHYYLWEKEASEINSLITSFEKISLNMVK